jgi:hypothetical protein
MDKLRAFWRFLRRGPFSQGIEFDEHAKRAVGR